MNGAMGRGIVDLRFLATLAVLIGGGLYLQHAKANGRLRILKKPAPLVQELTYLRRDCVAPYLVRDSSRLPEETELELGTRSYIQWTLVDPTAPEASWRRGASLFVTYYTGNADQVPHVPEECYIQGAFSKRDDERLKFNVPVASEPIDIRRLGFDAPMGRNVRAYVYYTFCVNGDFYAHRDRVRLRMGNAGEQYLYYSKIELSFTTTEEEVALSDMDRLAEKLMGQVLAAMVADHLPDLKNLEGQNEPPTTH
jgi:hypothetical protein